MLSPQNATNDDPTSIWSTLYSPDVSLTNFRQKITNSKYNTFGRSPTLAATFRRNLQVLAKDGVGKTTKDYL